MHFDPDSRELEILEADAGWALTAAHRLLITVWRGEVTTERISATERSLRRLVPMWKEHYAAITVLERTVSMNVDEEARSRSKALQARWMEHHVAHAYLVEGTGFLPAAVRTFTAGLQLVNRTPFPTKVFADGMSAATWVAPMIGMSTHDLMQAMADSRNAGRA